MQELFTLPELEAELVSLEVGQALDLCQADCERLFGLTDAALGRLRGFARGHRCIILRRADGVTFVRKRAELHDMPAGG